jgi:hypothetical protein
MKKKLAAAVELGHRGGLKGGPARAAKLGPIERAKIARLGGKAKAKKRKEGT